MHMEFTYYIYNGIHCEVIFGLYLFLQIPQQLSHSILK